MKLNLLLADDDITTVNHLQEIIERELAGQFSIFTASDGLMALKRLKETKNPHCYFGYPYAWLRWDTAFNYFAGICLWL